MICNRISSADGPYIEDVVNAYEDVPDIIKLALGSVYWNPPTKALERLKDDIMINEVNKYGDIMGKKELRDNFKLHLNSKELSFNNMEILVTAGGNQAFVHSILSLCDKDDCIILVAPYYCTHYIAVQMCGIKVLVCPFQPENLQPKWDVLEQMIDSRKPKMVVVTSPNNPSGYIWSFSDFRKATELCRKQNSFFIVDQTYHEFLFDNGKHIIPCGLKLDYERIIHLFSCSKVFGMHGWRVGFIVYPVILHESFRKIQDTNPAHATILSQNLGIYCIKYCYPELLNENESNDWIKNNIESLVKTREILWPILEPLGTIYTRGSIYFLVPVPNGITEEEAVDILAKQFKVLLMLGSPFGASGYLRLSYGSIPPDQVISAAEQLKSGFDFLVNMSKKKSTN